MSGTITMTGEEYDALHAEAEALRAENGRLSQQLAQSDAALRESRANDMTNVRTLEDMWERHDALRQEMEASLELLREVRQRCQLPDWARSQIDKLTATPAPEVRDHIERHLTMAEQGERQEAVVVPAKLTGATGFAKGIENGWNSAIDAVLRLNATPQPSQGVRALVSADDVRDACANAVSVFTEVTNADQCREAVEYMREVLLAQIARRQAQRKGDSHE